MQVELEAPLRLADSNSETVASASQAALPEVCPVYARSRPATS